MSSTYNRVTCIGYNTGKIIIGSCYMPKLHKMTRDEHEIQDLLLAKGLAKPSRIAQVRRLALGLYIALTARILIALRGWK